MEKIPAHTELRMSIRDCRCGCLETELTMEIWPCTAPVQAAVARCMPQSAAERSAAERSADGQSDAERAAAECAAAEPTAVA
jgi:hypothetical protein